ncbi:MAG TPA: T9SS type A sorting domain-containing protein, partial [Saprospiraceae bacterium]|nr:T9SS type A sorting domain-containing protein [Saprospiraceae bacterium]
ENERTVKFIFDPIMLPDSNVNEQASHGFIAFRLSPDKDLSYGTKLDNYADIYFDNNIPVKTNTEYLTVTKITSSNEPLDNLMFNYFPNPTRQELTIQLNDLKTRFFTLIVTDLLGNRLIHENCLGSNYQLKAKKTLLPGIYFLHIVNSEGKYGNVKFVVE